MGNKISDQTYGFFFSMLYFVPVIFIDIGGNKFQLYGKLFQVIVIIIIGISLMSLYNMLEHKIFKKGLILYKINFRPFVYFSKNKSEIFLVEILSYLEILLIFVLIWISFHSQIARYVLKIKQGLVWYGLLFGFVFLIQYLLLRKINLRLFRKRFNNDSIFNQELSIDDEIYNKTKTEILGNNISDIFVFFLILIFGIGGIFFLSYNLIQIMHYWILLFIALLVFNIIYIIKKTEKIVLSYVLIGSLPFGFIFPAFLPKTVLTKKE